MQRDITQFFLETLDVDHLNSLFKRFFPTSQLIITHKLLKNFCFTLEIKIKQPACPSNVANLNTGNIWILTLFNLISNGRSMCYVLCTRPTIGIQDQYIRKQDGIYVTGIQMVGLPDHLTSNLFLAIQISD